MPMPSTPAARVRDTEKNIAEIMRRDSDGTRIGAIKHELGDLMNRYVAVFRDAEGLATAQEKIRELKEQAATAGIDDQGAVFNQDVIAAIELGYMLDVAETIVVGAIERTESRGAQFRTDFPTRNDEEWLKHIDISLNGGDTPQVSYSPVTITRWQPEETQVLMPSGRQGASLMPEYKLRIRRYDPQSGPGGLLGRAHGRDGAQEIRPGRDPPGQGRCRWLDRHPLLVPAGDLRLVRGAHERQARAGLQHPPR